MATKTLDGKGKAPTLELDSIAFETLLVPIIGTTELITHRWSEKARRQMLDSAQGRKSVKQPKDPHAEYEAAFYRLPDGRAGMPSSAFKKATVGAARFYTKLNMTLLRQCIFVNGEAAEDGQQLVAIDGTPRMREDPVNLKGAGADLRYRPGFPAWGGTLRVTYVAVTLARASVLSLIDAGGLGVGVGDWRPEKGGEFGTYRIDPDREVEVLT